MKTFSFAIRFSFAGAALIVVGLGSVSASAAKTAAGGRKHAAKANQLAAKNKCKAALPEFTKAYSVLKDATILFNRAECQRKLGNNADALKDYEQFLVDMPTAPNRASVEAHMAALRDAIKAEMAMVPVAPPPTVAPAAPVAPEVLTPPAAARPVPEEPKQADKPSEAPAHRAEKWTD